VTEGRLGSGKREADDVEHAQLRRVHDVGGQIVECQPGYPCRQLRRQRRVDDVQWGHREETCTQLRLGKSVSIIPHAAARAPDRRAADAR